MGDDLVTGVIDTIDSANQHRLRLEELLSALNDAKNQVEGSAKTSREELHSHFSQLKSQLISTLDSRLKSLLSQVEEIEKSALTPLIQCESLIQKDITKSSEVLRQGKTLLKGDHDSNKKAMADFKSRTNELGLASLPEVPPLCEVACLFVETPEVLRRQLLTDVADYGRVISRAPVQITSVTERPGSLVIKWAEVEEEEGQELTEFCLQYVLGSEASLLSADKEAGSAPGGGGGMRTKATGSAAPHEVHVGAATSYTLRHIKPMSTYTFRVRGRAEGADLWSPWSVLHSAMTTLPHYEWRSDTAGYATSNENRIAERLAMSADDFTSCKEGPLGLSPATLFSQGCSYTCGQSLILRVFESAAVCRPAATTTVEVERIGPEEGVALTVNDEQGSLLRNGSIFVSSQGRVFLDGQEKLTKLPALKRGSVLTFETEVLVSGKVRVTVEVDEKIVTFDWTIDRSQTSSQPSLLSAVSMSQPSESKINLFFGIKFCAEGWRIGVE